MPQDLSSFLAFMGTPAFGAWLVSEWLEHQVWFSDLEPNKKSTVTLILYLLLAVLSFALVRWVPSDINNQIQPLYSVVAGTVVAFLSGQLYHSKVHDTF